MVTHLLLVLSLADFLTDSCLLEAESSPHLLWLQSLAARDPPENVFFSALSNIAESQACAIKVITAALGQI